MTNFDEKKRLKKTNKQNTHKKTCRPGPPWSGGPQSARFMRLILKPALSKSRFQNRQVYTVASDEILVKVKAIAMVNYTNMI